MESSSTTGGKETEAAEERCFFFGFVFQRQLLKGFSQSKGAAAVVRSQPWTGSGSRKRQAVSAVAVGGCRFYLFLFEGQGGP